MKNDYWKNLEKYIKSEEFKSKDSDFLNSDRVKNAVSKIKKNKRKRILKSIWDFLCGNFSNILSVAALIIAILSYLK